MSTPRWRLWAALPLMVTLHDGDIGENQIFLTTQPPAGFEYRCKQWEIDEARDGHTISLRIRGLLTQGAKLGCQVQKSPAPIRTRMAALTRPGTYRLEFTRASSPSDTYELEVTEGTIALEPRGKPNLTQASNAGKFRRIPDDWLFVEVNFMNEESKAKLSSARDEILKSIAGLGARAFEPAPGTYLLGEVPRVLPEKNPRVDGNGRIEETYLYHYTGDFTPLDQLMARYSKHTKAKPGRPYMAIWVRKRTQVSSTYGHAN